MILFHVIWSHINMLMNVEKGEIHDFWEKGFS